MGTLTLKLHKTDSDFIEKVSVMVPVGEKKYFHMPYWYEKVGDGLYIEHTFESLPQEVKNVIVEERNGKKM